MARARMGVEKNARTGIACFPHHRIIPQAWPTQCIDSISIVDAADRAAVEFCWTRDRDRCTYWNCLGVTAISEAMGPRLTKMQPTV